MLRKEFVLNLIFTFQSGLVYDLRILLCTSAVQLTSIWHQLSPSWFNNNKQEKAQSPAKNSLESSWFQWVCLS